MPWLTDEIPDWHELTDEEREAYRAVLRDLGMSFQVKVDPEEDDYCE